METEESVCIEIIESCPRAIPVVSKLSVGSITRYTKLLPFLDVDMRDVLQVEVSLCR